MTNVIDLTQKLITCPSVTPKDEGAQVLLAAFLKEHGFECHHLPFEDVPNLFARIGTEGPHICYAGHTDVVPPGPEEQWSHPPFAAEIVDDKLYGRGASDMKGSVAAFAVAAAEYLKNNDLKGSVSLLITGDEEGIAINGTAKVLEWMKENNHVPDVCLVGEPTNPSALGEEIKIGRRGSVSGTLQVSGTQGHVAYQHLADNPLPRLVKYINALSSHTFDEGTEFFAPSNLEFTTIDVGNTANNVIPASGMSMFNIRYNNTWTSETIAAKIHEILDSVGNDYDLTLHVSSDSFITKPCAWSDVLVKAVEQHTGKTPELTTTGGTSDARFIHHYCPVAEFGPINATIHQIDEYAEIEVLETLTKIYRSVLELYFA